MSEENSAFRDWEEKVSFRVGGTEFRWSTGRIFLPNCGDGWVIWGEIFRDVPEATLRDLWLNVREVWRAFALVVERLDGDEARSFLRRFLPGDAQILWYRGAGEVWFDDGHHLRTHTLNEGEKAHLEQAFQKVEELTRAILS